jgi:hypothetical protein
MKKIIFSLTAHESIECLYDLIDNIKYAFFYYDIYILIGLSTELNILFDVNKYTFVKIVSVSNDNVWGNIKLFNKHIDNMEYLISHKIDYDFFWFVASNELFIKIIPEDFIDKYSVKIFGNKQKIDDVSYEPYYQELIRTEHIWIWINSLKKDTYMLEYLYKNKFILCGCQHEGLLLPSYLIFEIFNEYKTNKIYENSTYHNYVMEEIFIPTYLLNKYIIHNINPFCFRYIFDIPSNDYSFDNIMNKLLPYHVSIKPVERNYNNILRTTIRNNVLEENKIISNSIK